MEYVIGTLCFGLVGGVVLAFWFASKAIKERDAKVANAGQVLDGIFNGDPVVTYSAGFANLPVGDVVKGGLERGYEVVTTGAANSYGSQDVVFRKKD